MSLTSKKADRTHTTKQGCSACSMQLALASSLPKVSTIEQERRVDSSWSHVTSWECPSCGAHYITSITMSNLRVREKPTSQTMRSARSACTTAASLIRAMLCDIFSASLLTEQEQSILREKNDTDS